MANSRTRRLVPAAGQPRPKVGLVLSSGGSASFYNVPGRI